VPPQQGNLVTMCSTQKDEINADLLASLKSYQSDATETNDESEEC